MVKIEVDKETCIGCGLCESLCGKSFKMVEGKAVVKNPEVDKVTCEKEAADSCPVKAIKLS
jgi:ferredoxin